MIAFVAVFAVTSAIAFFFFNRSMRLDPSAAFFAAFGASVLLCVVVAAAVYVGVLF